MVITLFQVLLVIAIGFLLYAMVKYYHNPYRKLQVAKRKNAFYFVDDHNNIKKNFQFVYKGCLFEGEKYMGSANQKFVVATIHIIVHDSDELTGITQKDLLEIEEKIYKIYPHAEIHWKHPINQLFI